LKPFGKAGDIELHLNGRLRITIALQVNGVIRNTTELSLNGLVAPEVVKGLEIVVSSKFGVAFPP
jgi:hypothetical protein